MYKLVVYSSDGYTVGLFHGTLAQVTSLLERYDKQGDFHFALSRVQ